MDLLFTKRVFDFRGELITEPKIITNADHAWLCRLEIAVRAGTRKFIEDLVIVPDVIDFVEDKQDRATDRVEFLVENVEDTLLRVAGRRGEPGLCRALVKGRTLTDTPATAATDGLCCGGTNGVFGCYWFHASPPGTSVGGIKFVIGRSAGLVPETTAKPRATAPVVLHPPNVRAGQHSTQWGVSVDGGQARRSHRSDQPEAATRGRPGMPERTPDRREGSLEAAVKSPAVPEPQGSLRTMRTAESQSIWLKT